MCPFYRFGNRLGVQEAHPELPRGLRGRAGRWAVPVLRDGRPLKGHPDAGLKEARPLTSHRSSLRPSPVASPVTEQAGDRAASPEITGSPQVLVLSTPSPRSLVPGDLVFYQRSPKWETVLTLLCTLYTGLLTLNTVDIWGPEKSVVGRPVRCAVCSSIPGLPPRDACSASQLWGMKSPDISQCSLEGQRIHAGCEPLLCKVWDSLVSVSVSALAVQF